MNTRHKYVRDTAADIVVSFAFSMALIAVLDLIPGVDPHWPGAALGCALGCTAGVLLIKPMLREMRNRP